ncbi:MAG: nuclear transport factor 2 family protein [Myxococcota bacterium]
MNNAQQLRDLVQTAMDAILVRHDREEVRAHFHPDFVQHNPWADDGGAHVEAMCDFTFGVDMRRWIVQGDLVAYHGLYTAPNPLGEHPLLCVDIWRVQGDQIVEHWDALMPTPPDVAEIMLAGPGDGFADVAPAQVASHAARARRLLEVGVRGVDREVIRSILAPGSTLHRPDVEPGTANDLFVQWVESKRPTVEVRHTLASGDLVLIQAVITIAGHEQVAYHLYRFDGEGRVSDLWQVAQDRLPLADAANPHPHF